VYTRDAYVADPDITPEDIQALGDSTHVIIAVLASSGPSAPLTPHRFVHNLAGGNNEALLWTADEIRAKAKEILSYANEYSVVAD